MILAGSQQTRKAHLCIGGYKGFPPQLKNNQNIDVQEELIY
jgi:hypothetical protein